ncbi:MAG: response regulator transcription factor [Sphingobacteriales bacterium]|nr:MAG: response regulator transcription factor [Sphingobacteriales bacterium]
MVYKVAIVDDKAQNRLSLSEKINYSGEVEIVLMAKHGKDFLEQLKKIPSAQHPHVVLMDIDMPEMNGIEAVRHAHSLYPHIKYIMLTVFDDDDKLFDAIQAGADGYLLKEEKVDELLNAIKEVIEKQGAPMSPSIARKALNLLTSQKRESSSEVASALSDREMEILKGLVDGLDFRKIAEKLFLSPYTVRTHIGNIYEKLHVSSKVQAVKLAIKNKWI